jgi:hypothetical protein
LFCDLCTDTLKSKYEQDARALAKAVSAAEVLLRDSAIDNTLQGARARLLRFNDYKVKAKRDILAAHVNLEALHSNIVTRLSEADHPPFVPSSEDIKIKGIPLNLIIHELNHTALAARIGNLQQLEQVEVVLHKELGRQFQLLQMDERHKTLCTQVSQWASKQLASIIAPQQMTSVGLARTRLKLLEAIERVGILLLYWLIYQGLRDNNQYEFPSRCWAM